MISNITIIAFIVFASPFGLSENFRYVVVNLVLNLFTLLKHIGRLPRGIRQMSRLRRKPWNLAEIDFYLTLMLKYRSEVTDMRSWMLTLAETWDGENLWGDCDDFAAFAKWAVGRAGYKAEFWSIFGKGWGHAVCLIRTVDGGRYVADTKGIRDFTSWEENFPSSTRQKKRWY